MAITLDGTNGITTPDLAVDTNTLFVDAANNRVGVGTSSPSDLLNLSSSDPRIRLTNTGSGYCLVRTGGSDASLILDADAGNTGAGSDIIMRIDGTERMRIDSAGNLAFNSGYGSAAVAYGCRAWVNFTGTGTVTIRGSGNVSSVVDLGVGKYRVNFTTAMQDTNYSVSGVASDTQTFNQGQASTMLVADELATTSVIAGSCYAGGSLYSRDAEIVCVAIHR
jgi:hypothetical protein